jgi:hypothetical protein
MASTSWLCLYRATEYHIHYLIVPIKLHCVSKEWEIPYCLNHNSLLPWLGNFAPSYWRKRAISLAIAQKAPELEKFPAKFPASRKFVRDIAPRPHAAEAASQRPNQGRPRAYPLERPIARQSDRGGVSTIRRAELTASETKLTCVNDQAIRRVLEAAGVEFIDANGGGPGVRLKRVDATRTRPSPDSASG